MRQWKQEFMRAQLDWESEPEWPDPPAPRPQVTSDLSWRLLAQLLQDSSFRVTGKPVKSTKRPVIAVLFALPLAWHFRLLRWWFVSLVWLVSSVAVFRGAVGGLLSSHRAASNTAQWLHEARSTGYRATAASSFRDDCEAFLRSLALSREALVGFGSPPTESPKSLLALRNHLRQEVQSTLFALDCIKPQRLPLLLPRLAWIWWCSWRFTRRWTSFLTSELLHSASRKLPREPSADSLLALIASHCADIVYRVRCAPDEHRVLASLVALDELREKLHRRVSVTGLVTKNDVQSQPPVSREETTATTDKSDSVPEEISKSETVVLTTYTGPGELPECHPALPSLSRLNLQAVHQELQSVCAPRTARQRELTVVDGEATFQESEANELEDPERPRESRSSDSENEASFGDSEESDDERPGDWSALMSVRCGPPRPVDVFLPSAGLP